MQLNALASTDDSAYNDQVIFLRSGLGEDQARRVNSYNGTSQVVTVNRPWDTLPNSTTAYIMIPNPLLSVDTLPTSSVVMSAISSLDTRVTSVGVQVGSTSTKVGSILHWATPMSSVPDDGSTMGSKFRDMASFQTGKAVTYPLSGHSFIMDVLTDTTTRYVLQHSVTATDRYTRVKS